ncbi:MAG: hypothetical protein ACMXYE_04535 [Candidatus Woesearchaeota archaeon]
MATYTDKVKRYYPFTVTEARNILITILIIGFMYGFNDGRPDWDAAYWSYNMLVSVAIAAITMLVFLTGQRLAAFSAGYRVEFQIWWPGLIVALILTFITRGWIWIPIAGGMIIHHLAGHRLGFFRYGLNMLDNGIIAASGPLANILFATIVKEMGNLIMPASSIPIIEQIYWFNLVFALVNMLPIPPLAGSKLLYNSRLPYVFIFSFILVYVLLAAMQLYSWIFALIGAIILWFIFYVKVENK